MDNEIALLEARLSELLEDYQRARTENRVLSERVAVLESENKLLASKVSAAVKRVESALLRLPAAEEQ